MNDLELIEKLCNCRGASGFEDEVLKVAREYLKGVADFEEDSMRNLYIYPKYNKGNRPYILLGRSRSNYPQYMPRFRAYLHFRGRQAFFVPTAYGYKPQRRRDFFTGRGGRKRNRCRYEQA